MDFTIGGRSMKIFCDALTSVVKLRAEDLYFETNETGLKLKAVTNAQSGLACHHFDKAFFTKFQSGMADERHGAPAADADQTQGCYCKVHTRSLMNILRSLSVADTCRFYINLQKSQLGVSFEIPKGLTRTFQMPLLVCEVMQPLFERSACTGRIVSPVHVVTNVILRSFMATHEEAVLTVMQGVAVFSNYVDHLPEPNKAARTQLCLSADEFVEYNVQALVELTFTLSEFRALLAFLERCSLQLIIMFSSAGQPIVFAAEGEDYGAEYALATMALLRADPEANGSETKDKVTVTTFNIADVTDELLNEPPSTSREQPHPVAQEQQQEEQQQQPEEEEEGLIEEPEPRHPLLDGWMDPTPPRRELSPVTILAPASDEEFEENGEDYPTPYDIQRFGYYF